MELTLSVNGNLLVAVLVGCLDALTAPDFEEKLLKNLDGVTSMTLDLEKLEYISSAGLRVLINAQKLMDERNGEMVITHVCENVMEIFEMTGFTDILTIK